VETGIDTKLFAFSEWIRATDEHASHHLELLKGAQDLLQQPGSGCEGERRAMAGKLERWRYQHLNEHGRQLSQQGAALVDALDKTAKILRDESESPARRSRQAIRDSNYDLATFRDALQAIGGARPLDEVVQRAAKLTARDFADQGQQDSQPESRRAVLLYAPLYVSSECVNWCTYCGFRYPLAIPRKHLTVDQCLQQARLLRDRGFRHLLLVGGDFPSHTTPEYYAEIVRALVCEGLEPSIEIAPQTVDGYRQLVRAGALGVTLYQETYDESRYSTYHVRGPKSSYAWRLEAHDRAAEAGMPRLGLGVLLGLADPRDELLAMMRHAAYLLDRFPDRTLAFSLPRIHEAPPDFRIPHPVTDEQLVRLYCALRIAFPRAVLVLSTRESAELRNRLARICITQMSAGSSTTPGGYHEAAEPDKAGQQFPVIDHRSPSEVASWLAQHGVPVCWSAGGAGKIGP
jgi:2-iminoacetate synthase